MSAKTYGASLYALAKEEGRSEKILSEMKSLAKLFRENDDYVKILNSPLINRNECETLLDEDFSDSVDIYLLNFLKILSKKRAVHNFDICLEEYERIYNIDNNIKVADIISAKPLSDELTEKLGDRLEKKFGCRVVLKTRIDKECIGGLIIETGETRIDASIKAELDKIKRALTE